MRLLLDIVQIVPIQIKLSAFGMHTSLALSQSTGWLHPGIFHDKPQTTQRTFLSCMIESCSSV